MKTVNSLSGGKTSSYLAMHYPADYNVFSLVRIDAVFCRPKDESIVKYVSDKIGMEFIATAESDKTLYVLRDLEQKIGSEITWVTGDSFEKVCQNRKALPGMFMRFCTIEMKLVPISKWWQKEIGEKVKMGIGFRYDEKERANNFKEESKLVVGKYESGRKKWKNIAWREGYFPLIEDKITHYPIKLWADDSGLIFPPDSNCVGCFWKPLQQLRKNWDDEPLKMKWFMDMEQKMKRRWKSEASYENIKKLGLQQDFFFGTGAGCQSGFCTN